MKVTTTPIEGVLLLEPKTFTDDRGVFFESFNQQAFDCAVGARFKFVQDNQSRSYKGVLRGLHYQLGEKAQGKLVRVMRGSVFDVVVDVRRSSQTFGQWYGVELSQDNYRQLWMPPGIAHGFLVLSDQADFFYKTTEYYSPAHERCLLWCDPDLGIEWPDCGGEVRLSSKDKSGSSWRLAELD